jgi:hypothetical protein
MLNRKLSDYIFYGILIAITAIVFGIRVATLGTLNTKITTIDAANIALQKEIDALEVVVQENKEVQTSHLYELYDIIPNIYSGTALSYRTVSMLESLGVDESDDTQRSVYVDTQVVFPVESEIKELTKDYFVVEVQVFFTTQDSAVVSDFLDLLYNSDQLFIVRTLDYNVTDGEDYVGVTINFLAIYDVEPEEES